MKVCSKFFVLAFMLFSFWGLRAEYESKGLFSFSQKDSIVTVVAKLPMAFHNILVHYKSGLKENDYSSLYVSAFGDYSNEHLQLFDKEGNTMRRIYLGSAPNNFIQNSRMCFMMRFFGGELAKIKNSVMLESKFQHSNYNSFTVDGEEIVLITDKATPEINVPKPSPFPLTLITVISIVGILLAISLFRFFKK